MPIINVDNLSEHGIISDQLPMQLPANAWSAGSNVRFDDMQVKKANGWAEYVDPGSTWDGGSNGQVYYAIPFNDGSDPYWVFCGLNDVAVTDGVTIDEITNISGDYASTSQLNWTGTVFQDFVILNNGVDAPQYTGDLTTPARLADISQFTSQATKCGAMRAYKNYLVALDVTKAGPPATRYKSMVKWSDSAALGSMPGSWDETDTTKDAGETVLSERTKDIGVGACIDCHPLRDSNIIYTDSQTWSMDFVGGSVVFQFTQLFKNNGILTKRCVAEYEGKHFVVGNNDVYVHDGNTFQSVIDTKRRNYFFSDMNAAKYDLTYVAANYAKNEMWICYCQDGYDLPNKALIWSWKTNSWGETELPVNTPHISFGIVDIRGTPDTWDTVTDSWDTSTDVWNRSNSPQQQSLLMCSDKLYKGDYLNTKDGTNMRAVIERTDLPIGLQDQFARIKAVYPKMSGGAVNVYVGSHMAPGDIPTYQSPVSFTPGTDQKVDVRKTGTHMAIRFESTTDIDWSLYGYEIEYEHVSRR